MFRMAHANKTIGLPTPILVFGRTVMWSDYGDDSRSGV